MERERERGGRANQSHWLPFCRENDESMHSCDCASRRACRFFSNKQLRMSLTFDRYMCLKNPHAIFPK